MSQLYDFSGLFDRLTENARGSLEHADQIARQSGSSYIGTEHILLGVLTQGSSVGAKVLGQSGITLDRARLALKLTPKMLINTPTAKGLSEAAKLTLKMSWQVAREFSQEYCGTEHILYSLLNQNNSRAFKLLNDMNISTDELKDELENYLHSQQFEFDTAKGERRTKKNRLSTTERYGLDLTARAREGKLDPLIGRELQLDRIVTVLARRQKNNPVLIGEPGVGKTAIVEGLAQRIVQEDVPEVLLDRRIITLDLSGMIAGTKYRGEFEERLKRVMKEVSNNPNVIMFIDEIHLLVGAGAAEGAIDAGNILKPALARGEIRVIGATTTSEYHKYIEKDAALERRLQPIMVPEATLEETIAIIRGLKEHYEKFHGVNIVEDVIEHTVRLSRRYMNDRRLPDKAIDLIDEAAAKVRISRGKIPEDQRKLLRQVKLAAARMDEAVENEDYQRAALHKARINELKDDLKRAKKRQNNKSRLKLTIEDVNFIVSSITGVPTKNLRRQEAEQYIRLERQLRAHIIGQDEAVHEVSKAIRRNRSGISSENKPIGSFIFMGPTGVGKTELAKVIARELFHSANALIKMDMSEFSERHTVARLVGAPAGYVGYDEGGQLTDKIRRQPHSVVLFDEIEKAHPEVFNILLQILDEGSLTDAKGRKVDFTNTIVIMTSNIGAQELQKEASFGFQADKPSEEAKLEQMHEEAKVSVTDELKHIMRPELLNRIDKTIVFRALTRKHVTKILNLQIEELNERLQRKQAMVKLSPSAKRRLIDLGYDANNGVRPLKRVIQDHLEDRLAQGFLSQEFGSGDIINIGSKKKDFKFAVIHE